MLLSEQRDEGFSEFCQICKWVRSKSDAVFWPQSTAYIGSFVGELPGWKGYLSYNQNFHTTIAVCPKHNELLFQDWVEVAQEEVKLASLFDRYCDRTGA